MMSKRASIIISVVVIIGMIAAVLSAGALSPSSQPRTSGFTIRTGIPSDCSGTPWYVGQEKGYFEHNNITLVDRGSLDWTLQGVALVGGQIDVIECYPSAMINLLLSGAKIHAVALSGMSTSSNGTNQSGTMHWLVQEDSAYKTVQDLVADGKKPKIGVSVPGFCMKLDESGWYAANNISMESFEYVIIPDPQLEEALRHGQIDVAILPESFYSVVEQRDGFRVIETSIDPYGSIADTTFLVFTDEYIKKNPDGVRAFIHAFKDAERWSNDHPNESRELTATKLGVSTVTLHQYSFTGAITDDVIQPWIDAMVLDDRISEGQIQPSDLYTTEFSDTWVNETTSQPIDPYNNEVVK
jgi:ABC-type nitrate/sulfonate/bicarbonate transport system substrate-binding protein